MCPFWLSSIFSNHVQTRIFKGTKWLYGRTLLIRVLYFRLILSVSITFAKTKDGHWTLKRSHCRTVWTVLLFFTLSYKPCRKTSLENKTFGLWDDLGISNLYNCLLYHLSFIVMTHNPLYESLNYKVKSSQGSLMIWNFRTGVGNRWVGAHMWAQEVLEH